MAGILSADRIVESEKINQKIQSIGVEVSKLVNLLDQVAVAGSKINESLGKATKLPDIGGVSKQSVQNAKDLATIQKTLIDIEIKLANAIKAEQLAKQSKINTDTKVINQIKAEQQAKNTEIQARIKNAQAIAAEERATQAGIRTKRLEQNEHKKTTSSFTRLAYSLRTYIAAYVSLQTVMSGVSSIFKQTKELDSLSFSMRTIIQDANELAQTQVFLSDTAKNYGLNLLSISERYVRFRAATIQSNMTAKDTQKIFDSVSRAASVLGLRTDEVAGVYLALEQMISKGKVTTEELRRQLGERLSGSFGIFAAAIGVSTSQLDKMLKKGEVLSADVLPKFADQLLKAYGIENVTRVENLAAAQGRLNTAWTEFIKSLEASKSFEGILNVLADSIERVNNAIKPNKNIVTERSVNLITESVDKLNEAETIQERQAILTQQILSLEERRGKVSAQLVKDDSKRPGLLDKTFSKLNQTLGLGGQFTSSIMFEQVYQDTVLDEKAYKEAIDNLKKNFNKLVVPPIKIPKIEAVEDEKKIDAAYKKRLKTQKESNEKELADFKRFLQFRMNEEAKALDETYSDRDNNARESALYEMALEQSKFNAKQETIDKEIELNNKLLKSVKEGSTEKEQIITDLANFEEQKQQNVTDLTISNDQDQIKIRKANNKQEIADSEKLSNDLLAQVEENTHEQSLVILDAAQKEILASRGKANKIKAIEDQLTLDLIENEREKLQAVLDTGNLTVKDAEQVQKRINNLEESYKNKSFDIDKETEEKKADLRQQTIEKTVELLNEGFNFASKIYDAQLSRAEQTYESEKEAAGSNLTEKIIAERKYEQEVSKIRKRQAIAEKAQAAMSIALNTAQAIISIWAQVPKFDFGVSAATLTALVSGIGALQLATVLATPIPAFYKGKENAPETFIAGDTPDGKGASELIHTKSGLDILTPAKATLFSDPMFKGAKIFPHDKTQEMLNSYAINGGSQVFVDMSGSEKYLNQIAKNTKNTEISGIDAKGRQFIKRGGTVTTY